MKLLSEDKAHEQELLEQLAVDLQTQLAGDEALREGLTQLLDQTGGISTAKFTHWPYKQMPRSG